MDKGRMVNLVVLVAVVVRQLIMVELDPVIHIQDLDF